MLQPWKNQKCKTCVFKSDLPNSEHRPIDLAAPKIYMCRQRPPQIVYAITQASPRHPPQPMPLGSMYPMIEADFPACSMHKAEVEVDMSNIGVAALNSKDTA